jgi:hypothetical protein
MTDTECFLQAVREYRAAEKDMGRVIRTFDDFDEHDRAHVLARAQELKDVQRPVICGPDCTLRPGHAGAHDKRTVLR